LPLSDGENNVHDTYTTYGDVPKGDGSASRVLDCGVVDTTLAVREEDHHRRSSNESQLASGEMKSEVAPVRTPVPLHDRLGVRQGKVVVRATGSRVPEDHVQQLVGRALEVVLHRDHDRVVEEDNTVGIAPDCSLARLTVDRSSGRPECVQGRVDRAKPIVASGRDPCSGGGSLKRTSVGAAHGARSGNSRQNIYI
jgi:hypothetical protein